MLVTGVVRRKAVECHRVHVQPSGHGQSAVSAVRAQGQHFVLCPHAARTHATGEGATGLCTGATTLPYTCE